MKRILITPGEPAGIGPDVTIQIAQQSWTNELIAIADPQLLIDRAKLLHLPLHLQEAKFSGPLTPHIPGTLKIIPTLLNHPVTPGKLHLENSHYVINTLEQAASLCLQKKAHAIVTGPVHKHIINQAGIPFTGHTEFFADYCHVKQTVMLFVVNQLKIAILTTHLPLKEVAQAITFERIEAAITILQKGLKEQFNVPDPHILVSALNPHAGEEGTLGREEIDVIVPALEKLKKQGYQVEGPLSADTIFTPAKLRSADVILAMYHDQALPIVKYIGFGHAVNVTLGLPFIRTSVDHGTALSLAGTGKAEAGSMAAAIALAGTL